MVERTPPDDDGSETDGAGTGDEPEFTPPAPDPGALWDLTEAEEGGAFGPRERGRRIESVSVSEQLNPDNEPAGEPAPEPDPEPDYQVPDVSPGLLPDETRGADPDKIQHT